MSSDAEWLKTTAQMTHDSLVHGYRMYITGMLTGFVLGLAPLFLLWATR